MRFQHGVDDSPTRLPISATEQRGILLQQRENFAVDGVHEAAPGKGNKCRDTEIIRSKLRFI